jgi:hypothetical protein
MFTGLAGGVSVVPRVGQTHTNTLSPTQYDVWDDTGAFISSIIVDKAACSKVGAVTCPPNLLHPLACKLEGTIKITERHPSLRCSSLLVLSQRDSLLLAEGGEALGDAPSDGTHACPRS